MADSPAPNQTGPDDETLKRAVEIYRDTNSKSQVAKAMGCNRKTARKWLEKAERRGLTLSEGVQDVISDVKISPSEARHGWINKKNPETGEFASTFWKKDPLSIEDMIDKVRDAFDDIKTAAPAPGPDLSDVMKDVINFNPIADVHHSMLAWGRETMNVDYDTDLSVRDMERAGAKIDALSPDTEKCIVVVNGDFFHIDDARNETPASKHTLDVDGRYNKVIQTGINMLVDRINRLLRKHRMIHVRVNRGNHDPHSHVTLMFALEAHYRHEPRIFVETDPQDLFHFRWGRCLIAAEHGDNAKPEQLALYLSDVIPYFSETRHRYFFTGHVHHLQAKDTGPVQWESMRAFCPPDSYAARKKYSSRRALQTCTFHKTDGLILRAIDPVERPEDVESSTQMNLPFSS